MCSLARDDRYSIYIHVDPGVFDEIGIAGPRVGLDPGQEGLAADTLDHEVQGLAAEVPGIADAAGIGIVPGAAQAAGGDGRGAEMLPDVIRQPYQGLIRLRRETVAVGRMVAAAAAAELLPGKMPDAAPEIPLGQLAQRQTLQEGCLCPFLPGSRREAQPGLGPLQGFLGFRPPEAVDLPGSQAAEKGQKALLLLIRQSCTP